MARQSNNPQVGVRWETVSLPIAQGVDLRSNDRARPTMKLAKLLNGSFVERNAIAKRTGHAGKRVRTKDPYFPIDTTDGRWVYGAGWCNPALPADPPVGPIQRQLRGAVVLGDQEAVWTGDRLLTHDHEADSWVPGVVDTNYWELMGLPGGVGEPLYIPAGPVEDLVTDRNSGDYHSCAEGEKYLLTAWSESGLIRVRVETKDGTVVLDAHNAGIGESSGGGGSTSLVTPSFYPHAFALDGELCVVFRNDANEALYIAHASEGTPDQWFIETITDTSEDFFDVAKVNDGLAIVAWRDSAGDIFASYIKPSGPIESPMPSATLLVNNTAVGHLAIAVQPISGKLGLIWDDGTDVLSQVFSPSGTALGVEGTVQAGVSPQRLTLAARGLNDTSTFVSFCEAVDGSFRHVLLAPFDEGGETGTAGIRNHTFIASKAFTVGNEVFITLGTFDIGAVKQTTLVLMSGSDAGALPRIAGAWARSTASKHATSDDLPRTVDFVPGQDDIARYKWCLGFTHTPRYVLQLDAAPTTDPVLKEKRCLRARLDFLPPLRYAQLGRSLYFAGAQPQVWDGQKVVEAGWLQWPEYSSQPASDGAGAIEAGERRYRVYYCRRNRFGEVTRSPALTSDAVTIGASESITLTVTITGVQSDASGYFEVYRTVAAGSTFFLVSGFDASTATSAAPTGSATVEIIDDNPDADIDTNPTDPHNPVPGAPVELEEIALPGCEVIASVEDRLWFAGGIVPPGTAAYSKHSEPGETAGWNDLSILVYQPDAKRTVITGIGGLAGAVALFRGDEVMAVSGDGPDNLGQGSYSLVRRVSSDHGATAQEGIARTPDGVAFWAESGPRVMTEQAAVALISDEVAPAAVGRTPVATVVIPRESQVRWYLDNGHAIVYDYVTRQWSVHTNLRAVHAAYSPRVDGAFVVSGDGIAMFETEGAAKQDAGRPYPFTLRVSELKPGDLVQGSHRCRRWAANGEWKGPHDLTVKIRYDGSPFVREEKTWDVGADIDDEYFGSDTGDVWGTDGDSMWPV